jgi:hypothetical protein
VSQTMQISIWIECFPAEGDEFGTPTLEHTREDDYLTNIQWWSQASLSDILNARSTLQNPEFWNALAISNAPVIYLGKRVEVLID